MRMMEIKFRGNRVDNGKWIYGLPLYSVVGGKVIIDTIQSYEDLCFYTVIFETVGQFTGLHDKNGKEIYEGDICTVSLKFFDIKNEKTKVIFKDGCFYFQYGYSDDYVKSYKAWETDSVEVIGNIHNNPEMLKEVSHETQLL